MSTIGTTKIIVIKEPLHLSVIRDLVSIGSLLGAVGIGVWLDSAALQWVAGIVWLVWLPIKGMALISNSALTIEQARQKIDEIAGATDKGNE